MLLQAYMGSRLRWALMAGLLLMLVAGFGLCRATISDLRPVPISFHGILSDTYAAQIVDRNGQPMSVTYQNRWNVHDVIAGHDAPEFLLQAFILSEDKRFHTHTGVDWLARLSALAANVRYLRKVRGASTITEQVVRMLNPRPRTLWSRWLEGWEAGQLEERFSKDEILEFYINQVPYAANRRGVRQAASYYFDRDLETLSGKELLALVVLVRAPSRLDLFRHPDASEGAIARLAVRLTDGGQISAAERDILLTQQFDLESPRFAISAPHFVRHVRTNAASGPEDTSRIVTTLDGELQTRVQALLDNRLKRLRTRNVHNGAVLVVNHSSGEVLAWVVAGGDLTDNQTGVPARDIDAVTTPRQPGSALKPFLYALALERGWTAATMIYDAPLTESVGSGLHTYQNYSRSFYGPVTLRQALGNSLNIPALKTLQYVGGERYLSRLRALGFEGLTAHPNFYGDGIALGNGEVTLYELVQAYAALANRGMYRPLTVTSFGASPEPRVRVFSPEVATLMANILSDPDARDLEFSRNSVLNLPVQTAVKTGTSSDFRDTWAVGFNYRYTVGVWMGNLDQTQTNGVSGSTGPALLLRSVFAELNRQEETQPLYLSPRLVRHEGCEQATCATSAEWFVPGTAPAPSAGIKADEPIRLRRPTHGLQIAYDPRLPSDAQAFEFFVQGLLPGDEVHWVIDGDGLTSSGGKFLWQMKRGDHRVRATVWRQDQAIAEVGEIGFAVK